MKATPEPQRGDYTLSDWLKKRNFSRSFFYVLRAQGKAPRHYYAGKVVRITPEADAEWLKAREAESAALAVPA
jgi:hypothetical protein